MTKEKKAKPKKRRKYVEYRYFVATPETGILGGIVARSFSDAEVWARCDYAQAHDKRMLVKVRMEYEL